MPITGARGVAIIASEGADPRAGRGDAEGLISLDRTPVAGYIAELRHQGFRVIKQKGAYITGSRIFVEPFAAALSDLPDPPLEYSEIVAAVRAAKDPDFRDALLTVASLGDRASVAEFVRARIASS